MKVHTLQFRDILGRCANTSTSITFKLIHFVRQEKNTSLRDLPIWTQGKHMPGGENRKNRPRQTQSCRKYLVVAGS